MPPGADGQTVLLPALNHQFAQCTASVSHCDPAAAQPRLKDAAAAPSVYTAESGQRLFAEKLKSNSNILRFRILVMVPHLMCLNQQATVGLYQAKRILRQVSFTGNAPHSHAFAAKVLFTCQRNHCRGSIRMPTLAIIDDDVSKPRRSGGHCQPECSLEKSPRLGDVASADRRRKCSSRK